MSEHPHLSRAPILEALVDFRVEPDPAFVLESLKQPMHAALGPELFPEVITQKHAMIQVGLGVSVAAQDDVGFLLRSADQLHAVQAQRGGFSFSRLRPYMDWEELVAGARAAWSCYVEIAKPRRVTRVAVRTINRMELPLPVGELRDWVRTIPDIPSKLPQGVSEVFARIVLPTRDGNMVVLTEALEPTPLGVTHCVVILDIDVFRQAEFSLGEAPWSALEPMRQLKNDFFFECVTPRTLELFR
jgi:uncharacterized protein (TIGR04255 family)